MYVKGLQFLNYRNLSDDSIEPSQNINVICGNNAQGKTNLLEALWLFCGGHSFRGSKDNEFIKFGESCTRLKVEFFAREREQEAVLEFKNGKKEVYINSVKKTSSSALIGKYTAVIFSPEDLTLVKRGPSGRRKFIDSAVCREKLKNAVILSKYNQTLNQRNALLKDIYRHPELENTLDIWDDTLCYLGAEIIFQRLEYIKALSTFAGQYHRGISDGSEELFIRYNSTCSAVDGDKQQQIYEKLRRAVAENRREDCASGFTNIGPHRDDFDIIINGKKAKIYASQGQQRSAVLSLKLAEATVLSSLIGEKPIILLDDVLSELDKKRQDFLLNEVKDYQVFITCCDTEVNKKLKKGKCFHIKEGRIK